MAQIRVINDWGSTLVDDTYENFSLIRTGTYQTSFPGTNVGDKDDFYNGNWLAGSLFRVFVADSECGLPLMAIRSTSELVSTESIRENGGTTFLFRSTNPVSFNYWLFGLPYILGAGTNPAVRIYRADGRKTFDSSFKYARIWDLPGLRWPNGYAPGPWVQGWQLPYARSVGYDASRTLAAAQLECAGYWEYNGNAGLVTMRTGGARWDNGALRLDYVLGRRGGQNIGSGYDGQGQIGGSWMVLDVTGY